MFSPFKRLRVQIDASGPSMTKQAFKDECDIHKILNQYKKTGILNHISPNQPQYLNLPSNLDLQEAYTIIAEAEDAFATLSSSVRDRYQNDPVNFLAALSDPSQRSYLEDVGVFKKSAPSPSPSPPLNPAPTPSPTVP